MASQEDRLTWRLYSRKFVARLERFELPTPWFVAKYSIQLSYRRVMLAAATVSGRLKVPM